MSAPIEKRWNNTQVDLLKAQWETKNSCSWIAAEINRHTGSSFSRNAVIGKVHRIGLSKRVIEKPPAMPKKPRNRRVRPERRVVVDLFPDILPADFLGIPFVKTTNQTCMYPEGDGANMLFCGQPRKDGSSYCPAHHRICWVKPREHKPTLWRVA